MKKPIPNLCGFPNFVAQEKAKNPAEKLTKMLL